jgi:hypothetical protein
VVPICIASIVCATILMVSARRVANSAIVNTALPVRPAPSHPS